HTKSVDSGLIRVNSNFFFWVAAIIRSSPTDSDPNRSISIWIDRFRLPCMLALFSPSPLPPSLYLSSYVLVALNCPQLAHPSSPCPVCSCGPIEDPPEAAGHPVPTLPSYTLPASSSIVGAFLTPSAMFLCLPDPFAHAGSMWNASHFYNLSQAQV